MLRNTIIELAGIALDIKSDTAAPAAKEIVVGKTNRKTSGLNSAMAEISGNDGILYQENGKIFISGLDVLGINNAARKFKETYLDISVAKNKEISLSVKNEKAPFNGKEYTAMTFNVLYNNANKNKAIALIEREMPDTIGFQEVSVDWYNTLTSRLGLYYSFVGEINDKNGQQWRNLIAYKKDVFNLVETQTKWLSATPSQESKVPDTPQYRILTWAVLEDKVTGQRITHYNTHMSFEEAARPLQFNVLAKFISETKISRSSYRGLQY